MEHQLPQQHAASTNTHVDGENEREKVCCCPTSKVFQSSWCWSLERLLVKWRDSKYENVESQTTTRKTTSCSQSVARSSSKEWRAMELCGAEEGATAGCQHGGTHYRHQLQITHRNSVCDHLHAGMFDCWHVQATKLLSHTHTHTHTHIYRERQICITRGNLSSFVLEQSSLMEETHTCIIYCV